jgi:DNA-binding transcriptional LysR family regulator
MLNLARLQVLTEVVSLGSFSAAAESLSYTQSAVSQSIARLEAETGAPLVVRGRRGVSPTAAGATLVSHAERIFEQVREAEADIAAVMGVRSGRLRVGTFPSGGATLMPPAVARFRRAHPDIVLTLEEGEPEAIVPRLRAGELDLALLYEFPGARPGRRRLGAGLRSVRLLEDPIRVALPDEHPLAAQPELVLADLRDEQWVQTSASSPYAKYIFSACLGAGYEPTVAFESDDFDTIQGLVAAGVGVALIPRLALSRVHPAVTVRELRDGGPVRQVTVATVAGGGIAPAARSMIQMLGDVAKRFEDRSEL